MANKNEYPRAYLDRVWFKTKSVGGHIPIDSKEWEERARRLKAHGKSVTYEGFYHMVKVIDKLDRKAFPLAEKSGCDPFDLEDELIDIMIISLDAMETSIVFKKLKSNHKATLPEISKDFKNQLEASNEPSST